MTTACGTVAYTSEKASPFSLRSSVTSGVQSYATLTGMSKRLCTGLSPTKASVWRTGISRDCRLRILRATAWHQQLLADIQLSGALFIACQEPDRAAELLRIIFLVDRTDGTPHRIFVQAAGWAGHRLDRAYSGETYGSYLIRREETYHASWTFGWTLS